MSGFLDFVRKQGVVGLTIGFILGGAVSKVVSSLVNDIINPLVGLLFVEVDSLKDLSFSIGKTKVMWGSFIGTLINFFIISFIIYFFFKQLKLEKLDGKKD